MKILKRTKLDVPHSAQRGGPIKVVGDFENVLATFQVPQNEKWSFNEILFFEGKDPETGADMFFIGLGGLIKEKI